MKKIIFFLILLSVKSFSQKNVFEFSLAGVRDKNFDLSVPYAFAFESIPGIDNRYAMGLAIAYERKNASHVSFIVALRDVMRKINYVKVNTVLSGFMHHTLELPLGLRYTKTLTEQYTFRMDLCPGLNYVLTQDETTVQMGDAYSETSLQFVKSTRPGFFTQFSLGLESKLSSKSSLVFFFAYQYQATALFDLRINSAYIDRYAISVNTNYFSFGLGYRFFGR